VILATELDLGAGPLAVQDRVADLDVECLQASVLERRPLPTATTLPCIGFSWAVSGMIRPALVRVSAASGFSRSRSCNGLKLMMIPSS